MSNEVIAYDKKKITIERSIKSGFLISLVDINDGMRP